MMKENVRIKYINQLEEYEEKATEYTMPTGGNKYLKHPFNNLPKTLSDDEDFMFDAIEVDYGKSFKFASKRLKDNKYFVLEALDYVHTNYKEISTKLRFDIDIIKKAQPNDFKLFGKEILNNKDKLYKIFENSQNKDFRSYKLIPIKIRSDINFFLKLLNIPNQSSMQLSCSGKCLLWATSKVIDDNKIISAALKRDPSSLKYLSKKTQSNKKIINLVMKKSGFLPENIEKKLLKKKSFIMEYLKFNKGHVYDDLDNKFKNDKDIAFAAFKINPYINYKCLPKKFTTDSKFLIKIMNLTKVIKLIKKNNSEVYEDICDDLNKFKHLKVVKNILK